MKGRYWKTTVVLPPAIYLLAFRAHHFILSDSVWMGRIVREAVIYVLAEFVR